MREAALSAAAVWLAAGGVAVAATPCSTDAFTIDGNAVTVRLCPAAAGAKSTAAVDETISVPGHAPLTRSVAVENVAGQEGARTIDDVDLARAGIARTLHLTIVTRAGTVRLEHALLIPGAEALK